MDKSGMEVKALADTDADIAYVTPSHQYPTGIVMPIRRRQELLRWADGAEGRYIIEDDYDSEFRYKGKPIPALQGMDATEGDLSGDFFQVHCTGHQIKLYGPSGELCEEYERKLDLSIPLCPRWISSSCAAFLKKDTMSGISTRPVLCTGAGTTSS